MKNKNWIFPGIITVFIAFGFLFIGFSPDKPAKKDNPTCRSQKINSCTGKSIIPASGDMIMENLSRQFLSISFLGY